MGILNRMFRRPASAAEPIPMDEATFRFDTVEHASAARFLELDQVGLVDEDAPTVEMDQPPVMNMDFEVESELEAEMFLKIAAAEHRDGHLAIPRPVRMAEGSRPMEIVALDELAIDIEIDFDE